MFYNLENLYDTVDDPKTRDDEFTPMGDKRWTKDKYNLKLVNLSNVFAAVANDFGRFPTVVGVSEVENINVMRDLASQRRLLPASYRALHYESNDARGVDVGMFYNPSKFELEGSEPVKLVLRSGREYIGRDILCAWGHLDGEMFCFYVCHFLSRRTGVNASQGFRRAGAETVRDHAAAMRKRYPGIKVIVMGDMNDCPSDVSLSQLLNAHKTIYKIPEGEYFNPFWELEEAGKGTSMHNHKWVLYDNIIVSSNLLPHEDMKGLRLCRIEKRQWCSIFSRNFMLQHGAPKRSYCGNNFENGYSDHLPVVIKLDNK